MRQPAALVRYVYIENGWPQLMSNAVLQKEKMGFIKQSYEEPWNNSALWCQINQTELWDGQGVKIPSEYQLSIPQK